MDGVSDSVLNDPRDCSFQLDELPLCTDTDALRTCVTIDQITAMETVYRGAIVNGEQVYPGLPLGTEVEWGQWVTGTQDQFGQGTPNYHFVLGTQLYKYLVFDNPDWDYTSYDFSGWANDTRVAAEILNATNTDLTAFKVGGGKLILWNGWADAALTAFGTIKYYEVVKDHHPDAEEFVRLFLLPGVGHCSGGPGADVVDWLRAIQEWVEHGEAPSRLTSTKLSAEGEVLMSRPICAYPARAKYDGVGDPHLEASFECSAH
jgi:feruloyl esterase